MPLTGPLLMELECKRCLCELCGEEEPQDIEIEEDE